MRRLCVLVVPLLLTACPGSGSDDPPEVAKEGRLVVGVQTTADITALVGSVHVVARVDDVVTKDEVLTITQLPKEIELTGKPESRVDLAIDAFGPGPTPGTGPVRQSSPDARRPVSSSTRRSSFASSSTRAA
jgi:hypothetical protein